MERSYYSQPTQTFLTQDEHSILGALTSAHAFALTDLQRNAWASQITFLQARLGRFRESHISFEFSIPRMGKRVDNILIVGNVVFVIEFKVGEDQYQAHDLNQVLDYALDLKNFHHGSHDVTLVPILVSTLAPSHENKVEIYEDKIWSPLRVNSENFSHWIERGMSFLPNGTVDPNDWEKSAYQPTPTIIEAAQVLYQGHNVEEISRSEAANLSITTAAVSNIIETSKRTSQKAICFLTGVPGSGKTLAGLNIACARQRQDENEHAVFLSGNGPLVKVLQEALARSDANASQGRVKKSVALSRTKAFIQIIHAFRDEGLISNDPPFEKVAIFDEAQRAWTLDQTTKFMAQKKGIAGFQFSEPAFLLDVMDRHKDWAVLVCLIGGGQEINTGEAGLPEWFRALGDRFRHWKVFVSDQLTEFEYDRGQSLYAPLSPNQLTFDRSLHLATSIRSFRSEHVSKFVKAILDNEPKLAHELIVELDGKYPIVITRDIEKAKEWVREKARGSERFGLICSSGALRLRPFGINVKSNVDPPIWFLNDEQDVRSSFMMEEVATEFDIQGLEMDWVVLGWDGDLRYSNGCWEHHQFRGTRWNRVNSENRKIFLKNAYRVLLTRARQGMVLFLPEGDEGDDTRKSEFYDGTYNYLVNIGIKPLI
jgi:hypothetical protein